MKINAINQIDEFIIKMFIIYTVKQKKIKFISQGKK